MAEYVVAEAGEIPPGVRKIVEVAGRSIGIFNVGGELFALRNRCPHQGAPLCLGDLDEHVEASAPGEYRFDASRPVLRCPWHGWEFDLRTGRSWFDPARTRVRSYAVGVEREAETFPVHVEHQRIVLEIGATAPTQANRDPRAPR